MPTLDQRDGLIAALAAMPDVIAQLLADHIPDSTGRCQACTKGGTGYPSATHPCGLHRLATMAQAAGAGAR